MIGTSRVSLTIVKALTLKRRLDFVDADYRSKVLSTLREALENESSAQVDFVFSNGNWVKSHVRWWPLGLVGVSPSQLISRHQLMDSRLSQTCQ
jgi:hypothetical protein